MKHSSLKGTRSSEKTNVEDVRGRKSPKEFGVAALQRRTRLGVVVHITEKRREIAKGEIEKRTFLDEKRKKPAIFKLKKKLAEAS